MLNGRSENLSSVFHGLLLGVAVLFFARDVQAATAFDPLIGIRIGQLVTNTILASPPMPGISGDRENSRLHLSPQASYLKVTAENTETGTGVPPYRGGMEGFAAALGFTHDSKTRFGFYGFGAFSQTSGEIHQLASNLTDASGTTLKDVKNTSMNVSAGVSFRPWSEKDFPLVIGFLGGPFVSRHSSDLTSTFADGDPSNTHNGEVNTYSAQSLVYGPMAGVQAYFKIYGFAFNPYFLYYKDLSNPCETYKTDAVIGGSDGRGWPDSAKSCNAANQEVYLDGTFGAYGLNAGFGNLLIGVYSQVLEDDSLSSITVQKYTLSYTFDF